MHTVPSAKQMALSTARSQVGTKSQTQNSQTLHNLHFMWERGTVVSSHYIPLSELSAFPAGLKQDWLVETRGMTAALGTLCFHGAESLPGSLAILHSFLGAEQTGREKGCPFHAPGMGREGEGCAALIRAVLLHPGGGTQLMRTLRTGSEWGLRGDTNI